MILRIDCGQTFADDELTRGGVWAVGQVVPLVLQRLGVAEQGASADRRRAAEVLTPMGAAVDSFAASY